MITYVWVLIETHEEPDEDAVRICGTYYDRDDAARWSQSRPDRNAIRVPLDGLAKGEVL